MAPLAGAPESAGGCFPWAVALGIPRVPARVAWCAGDPGIAAALHVAARGADEPAWAREATRIGLRAALPEASTTRAWSTSGSATARRATATSSTGSTARPATSASPTPRDAGSRGRSRCERRAAASRASAPTTPTPAACSGGGEPRTGPPHGSGGRRAGPRRRDERRRPELGPRAPPLVASDILPGGTSSRPKGRKFVRILVPLDGIFAARFAQGSPASTRRIGPAHPGLRAWDHPQEGFSDGRRRRACDAATLSLKPIVPTEATQSTEVRASRCGTPPGVIPCSKPRVSRTDPARADGRTLGETRGEDSTSWDTATPAVRTSEPQRPPRRARCDW